MLSVLPSLAASSDIAEAHAELFERLHCELVGFWTMHTVHGSEHVSVTVEHRGDPVAVAETAHRLGLRSERTRTAGGFSVDVHSGHVGPLFVILQGVA